MNDLESITISFSQASDNNRISLLLYGDKMVNDTKRWKKVMSTIRFIKDLQSFDEQLGNVLNYRLLYHLSYALNVICVFVLAEEGVFHSFRELVFYKILLQDFFLW